MLQFAHDVVIDDPFLEHSAALIYIIVGGL